MNIEKNMVCEKLISFLLKINSQWLSNALTIFGILAAIYIYKRWRYVHSNERKSIITTEILEGIHNLKFLLLAIRQIKIMPTDAQKLSKEIIEKAIPKMLIISELALEIHKKIFVLDQIYNTNGNYLNNLYKSTIIDPIIRDMNGRIDAYENSMIKNEQLSDTELVKFLYPSTNIIATKLYEHTEIGYQLINDDIDKRINDNFKEIIDSASKLIIK